ncbi:MAG: glycosyltransferase [Lachnospiraceae bacterium]|nr:glycosyltransferase [Lachnospiraceae bacterium]
MIRVLQVLGSTSLGGAESRIMDLYRHMDRDRIQFDFLVTRGNTGHFDAEIESLGGHVYTIQRYRIFNHKSYVKEVKSFFDEHSDYKAVHGHITSTASIYLPIAKKAGVPLTIAHARSAGVDSGIKGTLTNMLRKNLPARCDKMIACSDLAAKAVFGEHSYSDGIVKIMPNAVDVSDYSIDSSARDSVRREYGIEDKFVVGHTGNFREAKNHRFLIQLFAEYVNLRNDAVLMLVGAGSLMEEMKSLVDELDKKVTSSSRISIKDKIIFAGEKSPIAPFYQAFDALVFPSIYEGMPGTVVEAQAAGLRCLVSDRVTRQVKVTDLVEFESLNKSASQWAEKLHSIYGMTSVDALWNERCDENAFIQQLMKDSDYDVNNQVTYYTNLYMKGVDENR